MNLEESIAYVGAALDQFHQNHFARGVADEDNSGGGVPREMWAGDVDAEGWVGWKIEPSALTINDVRSLEDNFGVTFPTMFTAYLLARHHLFDEIHSRKHSQQILMSDTPSRDPLGPLRREAEAWRPLIDAQFFAFAEWGDAWGPMCFDLSNPTDGDYPIIWMDHHLLHGLGTEGVTNRTKLEPIIQPLYNSFADFFADTFSTN